MSQFVLFSTHVQIVLNPRPVRRYSRIHHSLALHTIRSVPLIKFSSKKSHEFASFSLIHSLLHRLTLEENT